MDASTPLDLHKGARLRTLRPLECSVSIHWAAPYTTGHQGLVPAGEVLEVNYEFPEESALVSLAPEGYVALEPWLAGEASSRASRYQGYSLMAKRAAVEAMRTSLASAMAKPPPTAAPLIAAITGLSHSWMASISCVRYSWYL